MAEYLTDEEPHEGGRGWFLKYGVVVFITFMLYLFYRDTFELMPMFYLYTGILWIAVFMSRFIVMEMRHISPKLIAYPLVTTTIGDPRCKAGSWNIYTSNDIFTKVSLKRGGEGFHIRGGAPTIITPIDSDNAIEKSHVCLCDHKPKKLKDLPIVVVDKILEYGLKPPYYLGLSSTGMMKKEIRLEDLPETLRDYFVEKSGKMELKTLPISYITQHLEESIKLANTFRDQYETMRQKFEETRSMIRRIKDEDRRSAKQMASDMFFRKQEEL